MENEDIKIYSVYSYYRYERRIMLRKHEEYKKTSLKPRHVTIEPWTWTSKKS